MTFTIQFQPERRGVAFEEPVALSDAAAQADVLIDHPCGANATALRHRPSSLAGTEEMKVLGAHDYQVVGLTRSLDAAQRVCNRNGRAWFLV